MGEIPGLPNSPVAAVIALVLTALLGVGGGGFIVNWRQDRRKEKFDDISLTEQLQSIAKVALADMRTQMDELRAQVAAGRAEVERMRIILQQARRDFEAQLTVEHETVMELKRNLAEYGGRIFQLEAILSAHNIEVPPWTMVPADIMSLRPDQLTRQALWMRSETGRVTVTTEDEGEVVEESEP